MRTRRLLVSALAAALLAAAAPTPAEPGTWYWGYAYLTETTTTNPACIWYSVGSACSGWNYWAYVGTDKLNGGVIHLGFQNNSWIRGIYLSGSDNTIFTAESAGCGGCYLRASVTWFSDPDSYLWAQATT